MTRPNRYMVRMALFLAAVVVAVALLFPAMRDAFMANAPLNGLILGVLLVGIGLNLRRVMALRPEIQWIETARKGQVPLSEAAQPRLLAPVAQVLTGKRDRISLSPVGLRSILDSIADRLEESRDLARYFTGLLIFLGLLGTFWGLLQTVESIGGVIAELSLAGDDITTVFDDLKRGLEAPLSGMGTAFSSSLFGLAGSLVVGFLDLQASQAQNRFYNDFEDWMSSQTKMTAGLGGGDLGDGGGSVPAYIQALLEQTADSLDNLTRLLSREEEGRASANASLRQLAERLSVLGEQMKTEQQLMLKLAEGQSNLAPVLEKLGDRLGQAGAASGLDEASRANLRSIEQTLGGMAEESRKGRDEVVREMRNEFKLLARTMAAIAEDAERDPRGRG